MSTTVTPAEQMFCEFQLGINGSFFTALINAMFLADKVNTALLRKGFSELTEVVTRYGREEGYYEDLVNRWNNNRNNSKLQY